MAPWLKRASATLHELAFVVTRDNVLLDVLQAAAMVMNCVQVYAYIYDDELPWGQQELQERIGYSLLHLHGMRIELQTAYWIIISLIIAMLCFAAVTLREMLRCVHIGERALQRCCRRRGCRCTRCTHFPSLPCAHRRIDVLGGRQRHCGSFGAAERQREGAAVG